MLTTGGACLAQVHNAETLSICALAHAGATGATGATGRHLHCKTSPLNMVTDNTRLPSAAMVAAHAVQPALMDHQYICTVLGWCAGNIWHPVLSQPY
jgi:hypothetical protein